jgi:uncharacterized protein (DUF1501 family)
MILSRRSFLGSAAASTVLTPIAPGVRVAFGAAGGQRDILISLFLRFGADALTMVPPAADGNYQSARRTLAVSASAALPIGSLGGTAFFLHPEVPELKVLYDAGSLAVVHAAGMYAENRSHFVSQAMMERGRADGDAPVNSGWLARHLNASALALPSLGAVASASNLDITLQGSPGAVAIPDVANFNVFGGNSNLNVIARMQDGDESHVVAARAAVATIRSVRAGLAALPSPGDSAPAYTDGPLSTSLRSVATLIKMNVGLEVAAVDYGSWDHHVNLNLNFPPKARELSRALAAFWDDLKAYRDRLTVVTMSEFGRRVEKNSNDGTDHGSASFMFVLGGAVNGGRLYGTWPGLGPGDLHAGDLRVTTDYRTVLQEILVKRRQETAPQQVFRGVAYQPLGILRDS